MPQMLLLSPADEFDDLLRRAFGDGFSLVFLRDPKKAAALLEEAGFDAIVVDDGRVLDARLKRMGLDRAWLDDRLRQSGCAGPESGYLMTVNRSGQTYIAAKEAAHEA